MNIAALMRHFSIRTRMRGAIAMVLTLFALVGAIGISGGWLLRNRQPLGAYAALGLLFAVAFVVRGIELRHFSCEIARLALIIAEYQCDVLYRGQQLALADLHVDVEQHVDPLRPLAVVVVNVDRLDDRRPETMGIRRHGHSNSMMGSTFHRRRMAKRLEITVMITQAISATTISRSPIVMPRCIAASVAP